MLKAKGLRFHFYSAEEPRVHIHVRGSAGTAKSWLEPAVELADNRGLTRRELRLALQVIRENEDAIRKAWEGFHGNG